MLMLLPTRRRQSRRGQRRRRRRRQRRRRQPRPRLLRLRCDGKRRTDDDFNERDKR